MAIVNDVQTSYIHGLLVIELKVPSIEFHAADTSSYAVYVAW